MHVVGQRFLDAALRGLLLAGLAVGSARAADLAATSLVTPSVLYTGTGALAYFDIQNLGTPLAGNYTAELVVSTDAQIDALDPVVAAVTNAVIGWQSVLISTSSALSPGVYRFGLRIAPVSGESNTANNQLLGDEVDLLDVDLALVDASPLVLMGHASDAETPPVALEVFNAGTPFSVLVFSAATTTPAPWLDIQPASGFSVAGISGVSVSIKALPLGLAKGVYSTVLRFQNWLIADDFQDVAVQLCVDDPKFTPGHRLIGAIDTGADQDPALFEAVAGEVLKLKLRSSDGDLVARLEVVDPDGLIESVLTWKYSPTFVAKSVKLAQSGEYTLRVGGKGSTTGAYDIKTNCKLPKAAKAREVEVAAEVGDTASVSMLLLAGASVDLKFVPNTAFAGPLGLAFVLPNGTQIDLQAMVIQEGDGSVVVPDIVTGQTGTHQIILCGFGADPLARVAVTIDPDQPAKPKSDVVVP